jgi:hypothetical protein
MYWAQRDVTGGAGTTGRHMIIDCHGHYTTAPGALQSFRDEQIAALKTSVDLPISALPRISDDQIRDSLENAQLKLQPSSSDVSKNWDSSVAI